MRRIARRTSSVLGENEWFVPPGHRAPFVEEAMKRNSMLAAVLAVLTAAVGTALAADGTDKVTGEVIDSACYIKMGARGMDHAKCAADCAKAGIPLAILTDDGKVVWVSSSKDMESANGMLQPYVARKVTVEGQWFEKGGTKLFAITKVSGG